MNFQLILFYLLAAIILFGALKTVTVKNPVHAALYLVLTFCMSAMMWMLMQAEFLGITLVVVYVGAVMVLFLFVVMMLDIDLDNLRAGFWRSLPVGLFVAAIIVVELSLVLWAHFGGVQEADLVQPAADYDNAKALGELLYTGYIYPLEIAGMILLVAMVAAIALTLRRRKDRKSQNPSQQVRVRAADRVRLVSMSAVVPAPPQPAEAAEGQGSETAQAAPAAAQPAAGSADAKSADAKPAAASAEAKPAASKES